MDQPTSVAPPPRAQTASWGSNSTGSSRSSISAEKYGLDAEDRRKNRAIYDHSEGALRVGSQEELCAFLDKHEGTYRLSHKPLPAGDSNIEILQGDLVDEPERSAYAKYPNQKLNLARVAIPRSIYYRRFLGSFSELDIVSKVPSPSSSTSSSQNNSPENSQYTSRNNTWERAEQAKTSSTDQD